LNTGDVGRYDALGIAEAEKEPEIAGNLAGKDRIMTVNALKLLEDALRLSDQERADMAARLIDSLDPEMDADVASAWDAEIHRRLGELDTGVVMPVPRPEARQSSRPIS
jgi:putative addiction module component (TIGR02574 family)